MARSQAAGEIQALLYRSPLLAGFRRSRWWLDGLRQAVSWLSKVSVTAVHKILKRLGIHYKRGRRYLHSPDVEYDLKMARVTVALSLVAQDPQQYVLLYEDELSYYRRPTIAQGYAVAGTDAPRADQGLGSKQWKRVASSINVWDGSLFSWQRGAFDKKTMLAYFQALEASVHSAYPHVKTIFVVLDNWPVHFAAHVVEGLASSQSKLMLLALPTYAPWTNPVEKVWHKLYREMLHLHEHAYDWQGLQTRVQEWLDQYASGSPSLLRYVGLYPD